MAPALLDDGASVIVSGGEGGMEVGAGGTPAVRVVVSVRRMLVVVGNPVVRSTLDVPGPAFVGVVELPSPRLPNTKNRRLKPRRPVPALILRITAVRRL